MLKTMRDKVLAVLTAIGLAGGLAFVITKDGCQVKSVTTDAGTSAEGEAAQ